MLSIRLIAAGTALAMAAGGAAAQTAMSQAPGKPLQLLQIVQHPKAARARPHAQSAAKLTERTAHHTELAKRAHIKPHRIIAARRTRPPADETETQASAVPSEAPAPAPVAAAAPPASGWPAVKNSAPAVAEFRPAPPPAPALTQPAAGADPSELVINGQTVQVASPNEVNALDLAADDEDAAETATAAMAPTVASEPKPEARALAVRPAAQSANAASNRAWIAQLLAALGGVVAAGSVAWFLFGSAPQRNYG